MSLEKFIEDLEDAIEDLESNVLTATTQYRALDQWDSLAVLTVIAMVDADYDVRLRADDLKQSETVEALYQLVQNKASE